MRKLSMFAVLGAAGALAVGCGGGQARPCNCDGAACKAELKKIEARVAALEARSAAAPVAPAAVTAPAAGAPVAAGLPQIGVANPAKDTWACVKVEKGPKVDGVLDDAAWAKAVQVRLVPESGEGRLANDTAALLCHDGTNLYIAAVCMETDMGELRLNCTKRDEKIYGDDCVEFYIDHDRDKESAVKFVVNANGVFMDFIRLAHGDGDDVAWNPVIQTAKLADRWILEIAIPLADMGVEYKPGAAIGFNALRMRQKSANRRFEASTWWGQINRIGSIGKVPLE